jgi:hypothetical protein
LKRCALIIGDGRALTRTDTLEISQPLRGPTGKSCQSAGRVGHYSPEGSQFALTLTSIARAICSSGSSRIKECRHIATRDEKLAADYLAFITSSWQLCASGCMPMSPHRNQPQRATSCRNPNQFIWEINSLGLRGSRFIHSAAVRHALVEIVLRHSPASL